VRILIVSAYFPPHVGGVEVVVAQHARSLAGAGHETIVATTRPAPAAAAGCPPREHIDGYDVVRLPASDLLERRVGVPYPLVGPAFCRTLWRLVRWCEWVHVHDVLYLPSQVAAVQAHLAAKPLCATQHVGAVHHDSRLVLAAEQASRALLGRYVWRRARRIGSHATHVYDHLRAHGVPDERIVHLRNGIDTGVFRPGEATAGLRERYGIPAGVPVVLFAGRLIAQKGVGYLLSAARPDRHVLLAGPGRLADLPVGVSLAGSVGRDDLVDLYRLADLFVLPAQGETFPLAVQEAMACGLPVITLDGPGYRAYDIDRELLRLVPPEGVVPEIDRVLADAALRTRMRGYSVAFARRHFDWRHHQHALMRMYS
jgi:glycosyltransferase involved in cell wall biosynthesis